MRKAIYNGIKTQFVGWYMLSNNWEVYLTEDFDEDGYAEALVLGAENEFGSVWFEEHKSHIVASAFGEEFCKEVDMGNLAPPENGQWIAEAEAA
ncbi:hypothetical protein [Alteromonas macleodii]|jgi:hypothetical protein|uniref:hypothetical protein n=1 Tax=Alteromonas macleodii TaxID=28108 RepID=UPI003140BB1A|tara:strand:- start:47783 stop:48064 length:282 start_codon:yes stop_codon:yes gene_type:complete